MCMFVHVHVPSSFSKDQALSVRSGLIICKSDHLSAFFHYAPLELLLMYKIG